MQIKIASVFVDDQEKALAFYTEKLGFRKMADIPMGPTYRWLTVVSPEGVHGMELAEIVAMEPRPGADARHLYVYLKVNETPGRFPRRPGMARKRPISASTGG